MHSFEKAFLTQQTVVFIGGAVVIAVTALYSRLKDARVQRGFLIGWSVFELLWFGWGYNPAVPRDLYYPETPGIRMLRFSGEKRSSAKAR